MVTAQLARWESYSDITESLDEHKILQQIIQCPSISHSQLSRRMEDLRPTILLRLFHRILDDVHSSTELKHEFAKKDKLYVIDSTCIRLPTNLADWAQISPHRSGVKVHLRAVILQNGKILPDEVLPSTLTVSDNEGADVLVTEEGATYVMDRGYVCYRKMDNWQRAGVHYVIRLYHHKVATVVEERKLDANDPGIIRDTIVTLGAKKGKQTEVPVRLIEFEDEKGRVYRLATTRMDLTARQIADLYRERWKIELFFKWLKGHLKFAKLYSYKPQAVWNHILLAMIAYSLVYLLKTRMKATRTVWDVLRSIRIRMFGKWKRFVAWIRRPIHSHKKRAYASRPHRTYEAKTGGVAHVKVSKAKAAGSG
jgi:hypothetical protein